MKDLKGPERLVGGSYLYSASGGVKMARSVPFLTEYYSGEVSENRGKTLSVKK